MYRNVNYKRIREGKKAKFLGFFADNKKIVYIYVAIDRLGGFVEQRSGKYKVHMLCAYVRGLIYPGRYTLLITRVDTIAN